MKKLVCFLSLLFIINTLPAQQPYPHLKTMKIKNMCGDEPHVLIHYDKSLGKEINKTLSELDKGHALYKEDDDFESYDILLLELKFKSKELPGEYYLVFSFGLSCDPGFYIINQSTKKNIGNAYGLEIYIPGGKSVYTTGHINSCYNTRSKYSFNGSEFKEIIPEFYYVGLKTKTLKPLILYTDQELGTRLAYLPANYNIEVLAAKHGEDFDDIKYLIKTEVGLLGWATIETAPFRSIQVEGITFFGD